MMGHHMKKMAVFGSLAVMLGMIIAACSLQPVVHVTNMPHSLVFEQDTSLPESLQGRSGQIVFELPTPAGGRYRLERKDTVVVFSVRANEAWVALDTLCNTNDITYTYHLPQFTVEDFNGDGFADLTVWLMTSVHGNQWMGLYLHNPQMHRLQRLRNTAESPDDNCGEWDAPVYIPADSTIHCTTVSSAFGLSYTSIYRLAGMVAIPVSKRETDTRDAYPIIYRNYVGENGQWKLKDTLASMEELGE